MGGHLEEELKAIWTYFEASLRASNCAQVLAVLDASITAVEVFRQGLEQF